MAGTLTLDNGSIGTGTLSAIGPTISQLSTFDGGDGLLLINGRAPVLHQHRQRHHRRPAQRRDRHQRGPEPDRPHHPHHHDWTYTGGTLLAGSSLVVFDSTLTISGDHTLHDVTFRGGGTKTIAAGDTLEVAGTLTLDNGSIGTGTLSAIGPTISQLSTFDGGDGLLLINGRAPVLHQHGQRHHRRPAQRRDRQRAGT